MPKSFAKVTGYGRTMKQEMKHLKYLTRFGNSLYDETGQAISLQEAIAKFDYSHKILGDHLAIALPREKTDLAEELILNELVSTLPVFVRADHKTSTNNPHMHIDVINLGDRAFRQKGAVHALRTRIDAILDEAGIRYSFSRVVAHKRSRAELMMTDKGRSTWKEAMRQAIDSVLNNTSILSMQDFEDELYNRYRITIARSTENSLTLADREGNKVRLSKLFTHIRSRRDILTIIMSRPRIDRTNIRRREVINTQKKQHHHPEVVAAVYPRR